MSSVLRWSSAQVDRERAEEAARSQEATRKVAVCPTRTPEPHELGEFPMSCHSCHMHADS